MDEGDEVLNSSGSILKRSSSQYAIQTGSLITRVFGENFGGRAYSTVQNPTNGRFILGKSITTNGFDISVLVIDKKTKKRPPMKGSSESYLCQARIYEKRKRLKSDPIPDSMYQNPFKVRVVGVDFGQTYAVGICSNVGNPVKGLVSKRYLTIKTKALSQPSINFRRYMEKKKTKEIFELERQLEKRSGETLAQYQLRRNCIVPHLSRFYNSNGIKKATNNKDKAQLGEYDYAVNQILKVCNSAIHLKHDPVNNPILFVMGDCNVGSSGMYSSFERHLVHKLRSLGYIVIFESEYNTSQVCPECHEKTIYAGKGIRIKHCINCDPNLYMHRDVMAGDNLARIGLLILMKEKRPQYLSKQASEKSEGKSKEGYISIISYKQVILS